MTLSVKLVRHANRVKMAVVARGFRKCIRNILDVARTRSTVHTGVVNPCVPSQDSVGREHEYKYELSFNEQEWKFVEKLLPLKLVPEVTRKSDYPSGWRPQTDEAVKHPYYVKRSKNHMLPVYLNIKDRGLIKQTLVKHIYGDLWKLHEELHQHLEETLKRPVASCVMEGNCAIMFKGDHVYYCQQFLLSKEYNLGQCDEAMYPRKMQEYQIRLSKKKR